MNNVTASARTQILLLGFATAVCQAALLREGMAALGGSELAWGAVLTTWLAAMAVGAGVGVGRRRGRLAALAPLVVHLFSAVGVVVLRATPALVGATAGELLTTWRAAWVWPAAIAPASFAGGLAFPALAERLGSRGASRGYTLEAVGALVGGLVFTIALAPLGSATGLCLSAGVTGACLLWRQRRVAALLVLALAASLAGPSGRWLAHAGWAWSGRPGRLARSTETRHQRLELSAGRPVSLYGDGRLLATFPDPYISVPRAHLVMLLHPMPSRALVVGAVEDGAFTTMLRHPLERLTLVEEDPGLAKLVPGWYGLEGALADPRLDLRATDPLRAVTSGDPWDLIVLLDGDPTTLRQNRTRSLQFFRACRRALVPGGVLVVRIGVGDTYLGGVAGRLVEELSATVRAVFPQLVAIPGEEILLVAGGRDAELTSDPAVLERRWRERRVVDPAFSPAVLQVLADRSRAPALVDFVRRAQGPLDTMNEPRAVLLAAGLREARGKTWVLEVTRYLDAHRPWPLAGAAAGIVLVLLLAAQTGRSSGPATAAVVGVASMGWTLLLLAAWQATLGSVYAEIGALVGVFMGGLAAGAAFVGRHGRPARALPLVLGGGTLLSVILAAGFPARAPLLAIPPLLAAAGLLTGSAFAGLADLSARGRVRRGAGIAFAADEAGAAIAALVIGLVALPWAGARLTAIGIAVIEVAAIPAVLVALRRGRDLGRG